MSIFVDETTRRRRPGPHRQPGALPRPAQPRLRHEGRRRCHPGQGRGIRRGDPGLRHRRRGGRGDRRQRELRRRAAEGRARRDPRGGRGSDRARRLHHRAHPGQGRGARLQPSCVATTPPPGSSGRTAPGSSPRASATSASPPARSRSPADRSASSAARGRSPTRRCTSSPSKASARRRVSGSVATGCPGRVSSTSSKRSRPTPTPKR